MTVNKLPIHRGIRSRNCDYTLLRNKLQISRLNWSHINNDNRIRLHIFDKCLFFYPQTCYNSRTPPSLQIVPNFTVQPPSPPSRSFYAEFSAGLQSLNRINSPKPQHPYCKVVRNPLAVQFGDFVLADKTGIWR